MTTEATFWLVYVIGVILTAGICGAAWGWNEHPGAAFAGIFWPLIVPILFVHLASKRVMRALKQAAERQRELAHEAEDAAREQTRILREAGLE